MVIFLTLALDAQEINTTSEGKFGTLNWKDEVWLEQSIGGYVARGFYSFIAIIRIFAFTAPFRRQFRLFMPLALWLKCPSF